MNATLDRIRAEVESHPVVLFMKGTPQFPMCDITVELFDSGELTRMVAEAQKPA